ELLIERRDLDEQVVLRQVEVRGEPLDHVAVRVAFEVERPRLVFPFDLIEVQQLGELALAGMGEGDVIALRAGGHGLLGDAHAVPAAFRRPVFGFCSDPSRSVHTLSTAMAKTPWPWASRSTTASGVAAS